MNKESVHFEKIVNSNGVTLQNFYNGDYGVPMQFSTFINTRSNDRRIVLFYKDYFIVVKSFGRGINTCTVKFWKGDFVRTISQWNTNVYVKTSNRDVCFFLSVLCTLCIEEFSKIARFVIGKSESYLRRLFIIGIYVILHKDISLKELFDGVSDYTAIEIDELAKGGRFRKEDPFSDLRACHRRKTFPVAHPSSGFEFFQKDYEELISSNCSDIFNDYVKNHGFGMISGTPMKSIMCSYTYSYLEILGVIKRFGSDDYLVNKSFIKRCGVKEKYIRSIIDEIFKLQTED